MKPVSKTAVVGVVGVSFVDTYPGNLTALADLVGASERPAAILRRDPANEFDANAVEVHAPAVGMLGHLPRPVAARIAPRLDAGDVYAAEVHAVRIDPAHPERPGVDVAITRVEESP